MASRLMLGELARAGTRAISKYTGTLLAVFVVQSLVMAAAMLAIASVLMQAFSHLPMFDEAVDGDLVAMVWCVRGASSSLLAVGGIMLGATLFWQLATWFLVGGLVGVFAQQPDGRGDTARCFGASGAATYLTYARLAVCALPGYLIALLAFGIGMAAIGPRLEHALTLTELFVQIVLASLPAALLFHVFSTVTDYARIELSLRHESHDPGVIITYLRTLIWVLKRPLTLLHGGLGWLAFVAVTAAYMYLAQGHPMYGTEGAITLFFVRQGVALLRLAIHVAVLGGQVALGRTRPLPPRRVEHKADTKRA
ncbi:MAG TPA: hypothetical protein VK427_15935 [Kofleriaceae bacterium]|nr:hypothetical protein [Kofleriaceae bacterium]